MERLLSIWRRRTWIRWSGTCGTMRSQLRYRSRWFLKSQSVPGLEMVTAAVARTYDARPIIKRRGMKPILSWRKKERDPWANCRKPLFNSTRLLSSYFYDGRWSDKMTTFSPATENYPVPISRIRQNRKRTTAASSPGSAISRATMFFCIHVDVHPEIPDPPPLRPRPQMPLNFRRQTSKYTWWKKEVVFGGRMDLKHGWYCQWHVHIRRCGDLAVSSSCLPI